MTYLYLLSLLTLVAYIGYAVQEKVAVLVGSGFRDKILEIMKKNSYEFEF